MLALCAAFSSLKIEPYCCCCCSKHLSLLLYRVRKLVYGTLDTQLTISFVSSFKLSVNGASVYPPAAVGCLRLSSKTRLAAEASATLFWRVLVCVCERREVVAENIP
ncbi:hypothetical protein GOODEAATRI_005718 [Goodea atripinnis]|uniref:Secreted protein n=1 Tax=Goodea atripinnis TaxID=208336 RepID=A0ABV0PBM6_9TELE